MNDHGIKISKTGYGVDTEDIRQILLSSKYSMLKYHSDHTDSVTINPGDTEKYVDFTHNLGYVPAYISYVLIGGKLYFMNAGRSVDYYQYGYSWADTTKVRCGVVLQAYNEFTETMWYDAYTNDGTYLHAKVGRDSGTDYDCGIRYVTVGGGVFTPYTLDKGDTIDSATLDFYVSDNGSSSSNTKIKTYGIKEANTAFINGTGRDKTTSVTTQEVAATSGYFGINVKDQVQEIVNLDGWVNGNAMGFYIFNNSSPDNAWKNDSSDSPDSKLTIRKSGTVTYQFRTIIFKDKIT